MSLLRTIARCAAICWNPDSGTPLLITGTRAGAVDADFSNETKLELWDLRLDDPDQTVELQPIASCNTDSRFLDIAWSPPNADHPRGIIAGALENGSLYLWDAKKFINQADDAQMSQTKRHTGPIKCLQFNPIKPHILATAGTKGELFIYDINEISNPFRLGTAAARSDDLECVAWNRKVPHILATGGAGGFITVWDLKTKKASLTLSNNRRAVGAIAWDPDNSTKLITATPDDSSPVILLWDLRNSNAPECVLQGHNLGILSISWCQQDSNLLLSCGKDNKTVLWNPQAGELLGVFPEATNWAFQTRFHPHNPSLSVTASFDGKISIHSLYNTNPMVTQPQTHDAIDGEDFFAKVQTQPQGTSFSLSKAPKWFERPSSVSFGYGGKLLRLSLLQTTVAQHRSSKIQITNYAIDSQIENAIQAFEKAHRSGDIKNICQNRISLAVSEEEKADWRALETLTAENPRKQVIQYLEFSASTSETESEVASDKENNAHTSQTIEKKSSDKSRLSNLFADGADGEDFLSNISATKGVKTDNPFHLYSDLDSEAEKQITQTLILGDFEKAMNICLREDRIADALIIANCGGKSLLEKAQSSYLSNKKERPSYLRLLSAIIGKNLWDIVYNTDLANWKEAMVTLCTYGQSTEFSDLCEALGDRIMENNLPRNASFCYLIGSKLEKVIPIWLTQLEESEKADIERRSDDSLFSIHALNLQIFMEKVTVFRDVTKFEDTEKDLTSGWKLSLLYDKYIEFADIAAAHGQLQTAERYLDLIPSGYSTVEVERNRVKLVSKKKFSGEMKKVQNQPNPVRNQPRHVVANNFESIPNTYDSISNVYDPPGNITSTIPARSSSNIAPAWKSVPSGPPPRSKDVGQWNDTPMVVKPPTVRRATPLIHQNSVPPLPIQQQNMSIPPLASQYSSRPVPTPPPPPPKGPAPARMKSPSTAGLPQQFIPTPLTMANHYAPQATSGQTQYAPPIAPVSNPFPPQSAPPQNQFVQQTIPSPAQYILPSAPASNPYVPQSVPNQNQYVQQPISDPIQYVPQTALASNRYAPQMIQTVNQNLPQTPSTSHKPNQTSNERPPNATTTNPNATVKHPVGDRSHIPPNVRRMVEQLSEEMKRVASKAPSSFTPQVKDTQKRLNILFDHLNNEELIKVDTIQKLNQLTEALISKNYDIAVKIQIEIQKEKVEECGNWMVGIKRLISMSKVTP